MFDIKIRKQDLPLIDDKDKKMIERENMKTMNNILLTLQNSVVAVTPVGATGAMRNSMFTVVKKKLGDLIGTLGFNVKYAPAVNDGRKASPVSKTGQVGLKRWIEKSSRGRAWFSSFKNKYPKSTIDGATFVLARSLKNKARKGQKFFEEGIENAESDVNNIVSKLGDNLVRELVK